MISSVIFSRATQSNLLLSFRYVRLMKPLTVVPLRQIHARGYNNMEDVMARDFHEINFALMNAKNTPAIAYIYNKFGQDKMTPEQIFYGFNFIAQNELDRSPDFWNLILPMVKKQIKSMDRQTIPALLQAIKGAAAMYLQDNEFWESVEQKLVDQKLYKYLSLEEMAQLLCDVGRVGRGSDDLVELIEKYLIKHRKGLTPETIELAKIGFIRLNKGSEILQRVL